MTPNEEFQIIKTNQENLKAEIGMLLLHSDVLEKLIEQTKKKFESPIVRPASLRNIKTLSGKELQIDLIPLELAGPEAVKARYEWYHYCRELAEVKTAIDTKTALYHEYNEHLKQHFARTSKKVSDEMIYDMLQKAQALKNLSTEEAETLQGIVREMPKRLSGGPQLRLEVYEALQNLILQHG
jgi:hypothetical protein